MAKKYHPDMNQKDPEAQQKFQLVSEAYEVLGDETKRQQYDAYGAADGGSAFHGGSGSYQDFQNFHSSINPEELFRKIFGEAGFKVSGFSDFDDFDKSESGFASSSEVTMNLSFQQATRGCTRSLDVQSMETCPRCHGDRAEPGTRKVRCHFCNGTGIETLSTGGFVMRSRCRRCGGSRVIVKTPCAECNGKGKTRQRRRVVVNVPAGVEDGQTLRMPIGGREIFITFRVEKNKIYRRDGADVHSDVIISLSQAILGGTVRVLGVHEDILFTIPPGTSSHTRFCLTGKGIQRSHTFGYGDHYIHVKIDIPTKLTPQQRALLLTFAETETDTEGSVTSIKQTANGKQVCSSDGDSRLIEQLRTIVDDDDTVVEKKRCDGNEV